MCLQDFPAKWIYEPWKAPIADQKQANCRIGVDYPKPMVDHAVVSKENIQKLKDAYAANSPASKIKAPPPASPAARAMLPGKIQATIPVGMSTCVWTLHVGLNTFLPNLEALIFSMMFVMLAHIIKTTWHLCEGVGFVVL